MRCVKLVVMPPAVRRKILCTYMKCVNANYLDNTGYEPWKSLVQFYLVTIFLDLGFLRVHLMLELVDSTFHNLYIVFQKEDGSLDVIRGHQVNVVGCDARTQSQLHVQNR